MTNEERLVFSSLRHYLREDYAREIGELLRRGISWDAFFTLVAASDVGPPILETLLRLDPDIPLARASCQSHLERIKHRYRRRTILLWQTLETLLAEAGKSTIPVTVLKGMVWDEILYHKIGIRNTSDIDLLIDKNDSITFGGLMTDAGFKLWLPAPGMHRYEQDCAQQLCFYTHSPDGELIAVNAHTDILYEPLAVRGLAQAFRDNAVTRTLSGLSLRTLQTEDTLTCCLVEFYKDLIDERRFLVKRLLDIAALLKEYGDTLSWDSWISRPYNQQITTLAFTAFLLCTRFFGPQPIPAQTWDQLRPSPLRKLFIRHFVRTFSAQTAITNSQQQLVLTLFTELILHNRRWRGFFFRYCQLRYPNLITDTGGARIRSIVAELLRLAGLLLRKAAQNLCLWAPPRK